MEWVGVQPPVKIISEIIVKIATAPNIVNNYFDVILYIK